MSALLWSYVDVFLSKLRSVQYYYEYSQVGGYDYHGLILYDYVRVTDTLARHKQLAKAEV